jgi:hypothetical protein
MHHALFCSWEVLAVLRYFLNSPCPVHKEALIYSTENKSVLLYYSFSQFSAGKQEKQYGTAD